MKTPALFNPQPAAQANRRSADFFERCRVRRLRTDQTKNDASVDISAAAALPLLCEARLNDDGSLPTSSRFDTSVSGFAARETRPIQRVRPSIDHPVD